MPPPVLIGYRGSGKTTIGRLLADASGVPLLDTDQLVIDAAGKSIADIFQDEGEPHFRALEEQAVAEAVGQHAVVATGGGAVLREANRRQLATRTVVYLKADVATLAARIAADGPGRPSLTGDGPAAEVAAVLAEREPIYESLADVTVDAAESPAALVARLLATWGGCLMDDTTADPV